MPKSIRKLTSVLLIVSVLFFLTGCGQDPVTKSGMLLDTVVTVTLYDGTQEDLDAAFTAISGWDDRLDAFSDTSEIGQINSETPTVLSDEIYGLLKDSVTFSGTSSDAFDPVLGSLIDLWHIQDPEEREAPTQEQIDEARSHSGTNLLILDDSAKTALLTDSEASVNLGADAKGFVGDQIKTLLEERGVKHGLINLGGNIVLIGGKSDREDFTIGIDNPFDTSKDPIATLALSDVSIVTSGDYQRWFTDSSGKKYHHILDPSTGYPAESGLTQVVVVAESSETADMLSTTLFVMGKEKGLEFLKEIDPDGKIGAVFTEKDGTVTVTENLKGKFELNTEYQDELAVSWS